MLGPFDFKSYLIVALIFIPLEMISPLRPKQKLLRRNWYHDVTNLLGNTILIQLGLMATIAAMIAANRLWMPHAVTAAMRGQPVWLQLLEIILIADIGFYWAHRAFHTVPFLVEIPFPASQHRGDGLAGGLPDSSAGPDRHQIGFLSAALRAGLFRSGGDRLRPDLQMAICVHSRQLPNRFRAAEMGVVVAAISSLASRQRAGRHQQELRRPICRFLDCWFFAPAHMPKAAPGRNTAPTLRCRLSIISNWLIRFESHVSRLFA